MKLAIEFEKVIFEGIKMYRITKIESLKRDELPNTYIGDGACVFAIETKDVFHTNYFGDQSFCFFNTILAGSPMLFSKNYKNKLAKHFKKSAKRLSKINKKIKRSGKDRKWQGIERIEF